MQHYYIENKEIGYCNLGLFPYPKDALNFFKLLMTKAHNGKIYYLHTEKDEILAKGKGVPQGTTWVLSPGLLGSTHRKVGERW